MPFTSGPNGNYILRGPGFYISFRPHNSGPLAGTYWDGPPEGETAIVAGPGRFYILNGDHKAAYEALALQGLGACIEYFRAHSALVSSWSDNPDKAPSNVLTH